MNNKLDAKTKFNILDLIDERPIEVVDQLDTVKNNIDMAKLTTFMSKKDEFNTEDATQSDFLIVDNFVEFFGSDFQIESLHGCRSESEALATKGQLREAGFGRKQTL